MNARSKGFLVLLAIILLAVPTIATLVSPTTYHKGALIYAEYWDFHGEVGARNGSMENVSLENATNVNTSNLNVSSKFYVNTSGAIYQGTYNGSTILQDYLDPRLLNNSNESILIEQKVDSCTGSTQAVGWNGTGFPCKTISASVTNGTGINITGSVVSQILSYWDYSTHFEGYAVNNGWQIYDNYTISSVSPDSVGAVVNITRHQIYLNTGTTRGNVVFNTTDRIVIDSNPIIVNFLINYSNATAAANQPATILIGLNDTFPHRLGGAYIGQEESGRQHLGFYLNHTGWYTMLADDNSAQSDPVPANIINNNTLLTIEANSSRVRYWVNGTFIKEYLGTANMPTIPLSVGVQADFGTGSPKAPNQIWIDYMSVKKVMGY